MSLAMQIKRLDSISMVLLVIPLKVLLEEEEQALAASIPSGEGLEASEVDSQVDSVRLVDEVARRAQKTSLNPCSAASAEEQEAPLAEVGVLDLLDRCVATIWKLRSTSHLKRRAAVRRAT